MNGEFLIKANLSFAYIVFVCLFVLCVIFFHNKMFSAQKTRMQLFRMLLVLGIGWNFCSLITVLPNPVSLNTHLFNVPIIVNTVFMIQTFFWLPFGYFVYKTLAIAFNRKPSKFLTIYTFAGILVYWILFFICLFTEPLDISGDYLIVVITISGYFLLVVPSLIISGINALLWGIESWELQEKFYYMRIAAILFLFGFLALGQDIFLPYVFYGGADPTSFLKNTQIWASIFLLAFYQNLVPKIEYTQLQKISFHVDHIINDGVIVYNEKGRISFANTAAPFLLHLSEERLKKMNIQKIFPQINVFESSFRQSILLVMRNISRSFLVSVVQDAFWYGSKHYMLIFSDVTAENSILHKYESFKDRAMQRELQSQQQMLKVYEEGRSKERLLQTLIDNLPFRVAVKNQSGTYILQNVPDKKYAGDLYGLSSVEPELRESEKDALQGKVGHYDKIEYKEGESGDIAIAEHITYLPVPMENDEYFVIRLVQDLTEAMKMEEERKHFRAREEQRTRLEELGSLAGGIAHDFNNILGAQQGFCELAMATVEETSRTNKYLQEIEKACHRAKIIISQMLTGVRQLKQTKETKKTFRFSILLQDLITQVRLTLPPNIVIVSGSSESDVFLQGVEMDLFRVLQNLINNAVFAMKESGGELRIFVERVYLKEAHQEGFSQTIPAGAYARIDISDTGSGIKGNELQKIFSPFFTTKPPGEGLGLGLSSAISLVRQAQGEIIVQSILGKGTTFSVYWPLMENNEGDDYGKSAYN